jgi:hypothetical protein
MESRFSSPLSSHTGEIPDVGFSFVGGLCGEDCETPSISPTLEAVIARDSRGSCNVRLFTGEDCIHSQWGSRIRVRGSRVTKIQTNWSNNERVLAGFGDDSFCEEPVTMNTGSALVQTLAADTVMRKLPKAHVVSQEIHSVVGRVVQGVSEYDNAKADRTIRGCHKGVSCQVPQVSLSHSMRKGHQPDESRTANPNRKRLTVTESTRLLRDPTTTTISARSGYSSNVAKAITTRRSYRLAA